MDIILVFVVLLIATQVLLNSLAKKHLFFNKKLLNYLYFYHLVFFLVYYTYTIYNPSDSKFYYLFTEESSLDWFGILDTNNGFIHFLAYPFVKIGLSYESLMLIFSWFGYVGFVFAYLFMRENIPINVKVFKKYDLLTLLLFLPNMHFWTVSLGKGSVIFMGLMIFTYAVKSPYRRWFLLIFGGFFVYMVRPHVMLFMLVSVTAGLWFGKEKMSTGLKFLIVIASIGFLAAASNSILAVAKLENSENVISDFETFAESRSQGLSEKAGSGVAMSNYPLPVKLFTFWFRPLFVDSPGVLGIFSSFENFIYLLLFAKICNKRFIKFYRNSVYMVKMSAIAFLLTSFAMTFVMSNLGIIMRQKSMVMYFAFFVIYYFLAQEEYDKQQKRGLVLNDITPS
ncbi:hypothetical protein [Flavobacterium sp.]|uniref:hypothetical protein n=1 Tax=Flavobacterium sp. TaxID=239 RepID=UPI0025BD20F6|nr:hypothetical protein [Flavobacterium sp.]